MTAIHLEGTGRYGCPLPEHKHLRFSTLTEKKRHIRAEHPKPGSKRS